MSSSEVRLIDANALKNEMQRVVIDIADTPAPDEYTSKLVAMLAKVFQKKIDEAPAVDAEPVRHGRWIRQDDTYTRYVCSECKSKNHGGHGRYCPNCGAKLDAEVEVEDVRA